MKNLEVVYDSLSLIWINCLITLNQTRIQYIKNHDRYSFLWDRNAILLIWLLK